MYDRFGTKIKLKDILIDTPVEFVALKSTFISCSTTSYFNLFFEPGSGLENTSDPVQNARRAVVCKVFEDVANFINSPLTANGNKVNIIVKNFATENVPAGTLGIASSYFISPTNINNTLGGILDGEVWKTIHLGVDSYANISNATNTFYHGKVAFNFNDPNIQWNTNLSINTPSDLYDLYTVMLHEVAHALGLNSFINQNGISLTNSNYYSRYDTFLKTNINITLLTIGACSMYDISFNSAVSPIVIRPGCSLPNNISSGVLNTTLCNNAIKYSGSTTIPVYTPTCYEPGSSLSHFEDMLFPSCTSSYGNDNYFVLSNVSIKGKTKRYFKPEERNVLCDIGYSAKTTFGVSSTASGYYNYGGTVCNGITVAGLNDGINTNGTYGFIGNVSTNSMINNIPINGASILANDLNALGFECLQDITAIASLSVTSGTASTTINFSSTIGGLHLLRYIPINGLQKGNITYIYVYVKPPANNFGCSPTPNTCNLVMNGDFEQFSSTSPSTRIDKTCGWGSVYPSYMSSATPTYFSSIAYSYVGCGCGIPCNTYGFQTCKNNIGNGYANIHVSNGIGGKQHLYTKLNTPLQPNTNYQLSFDASLSEARSYFASNLQACLYNSTSIPPTILPYNNFTADVEIPRNAIRLISPTITRNTQGWDTISFNFTTTSGGEQYLYLGLLKNAVLVSNTPTTSTIGCNYSAYGSNTTAYYIDNVSLIPTNGAKFDLPSSICSSQSINDISTYLSGVTPNGVFSGSGVTVANSVYSFNAATAGVGIFTIGYTFTNSNGCTTTLYDTISVITNTVIDAINDDFSNMQIEGISGGVTGSVYANDFYNSLPSSSESLTNISFNLVNPLSITGAKINNMGLIYVPPGTPIGTYTLTYTLSICGIIDTATVLIYVSGVMTPTLVPAIRANSGVYQIGLQSTGKSIISGAFTTYNNISVNHIARLNTDLTLDTTFNTSSSNLVIQWPRDIAVQSDNKLIVVGSITGLNGISNSKGIARLLPDGGIDSGFNAGGVGTTENIGFTRNETLSCVALPNGKLLIGGDFYSYNGVRRPGIARLNSNGALDDSFDPLELNFFYRSIVKKILVQPDGKILLLGFFQTPILGNNVKYIIRLLPDGQIDTSFTMGDTLGSLDYVSIGFSSRNPLANMALQPDGKIIVVGPFTKYNGVSVNCIVRLLITGQVDNTFITTIGVERAINDLLIEPITNKIIVGGEFSFFGNTPVKKIIRLLTTGALDTTFNIGTGTSANNSIILYPPCAYCTNFIQVLKQQTDRKIIVGGKFTDFNGLSASNITRIFGSNGEQARNSIIEFKSEPEIDTNLNTNYPSTIVIYPNPSSGIYTIDLTYEKKYSNVKVYNLLGTLVYEKLLVPEEQNQIDITHLSKGYYISHISNENSNTQHKLIKN